MQNAIHSDTAEKLAEWLKSEREKQGLSMRDVASVLNVPHSFIQKVESRERRLDVVEYVQYCDALSLKAEDGIKLIRKALQVRSPK